MSGRPTVVNTALAKLLGKELDADQSHGPVMIKTETGSRLWAPYHDRDDAQEVLLHIRKQDREGKFHGALADLIFKRKTFVGNQVRIIDYLTASTAELAEAAYAVLS